MEPTFHHRCCWCCWCCWCCCCAVAVCGQLSLPAAAGDPIRSGAVLPRPGAVAGLELVGDYRGAGAGGCKVQLELDGRTGFELRLPCGLSSSSGPHMPRSCSARTTNHHHQSLSLSLSLAINGSTASLATQQPQHSSAEQDMNGRAQHPKQRLPGPPAARSQLHLPLPLRLCGFFSFQLAPSSESFRSPQLRLSQLWLATARAGQAGTQADKTGEARLSPGSCLSSKAFDHPDHVPHTPLPIPRYATQRCLLFSRGPPELHRLQAVGFMLQSLSQSPPPFLSCPVQPSPVQFSRIPGRVVSCPYPCPVSSSRRLAAGPVISPNGGCWLQPPLHSCSPAPVSAALD